MAKTLDQRAPAQVVLPGGMVVSCLQQHEVAIINREVQGYFTGHLALRLGDVVFDVGANIGLFSVAVSQRCDGDVRLHAFEPVRAIFGLQHANVVRHGIAAEDWPKIRQVVVEVHDMDDRLATAMTLLRAQGLTKTVVDQPATPANSNIHTVFASRPL